MTAYELVHWEKPISDLRAWDRSPEVQKEYAVPSESDPEKAYIVTEIDALKVPFKESDVVEDSETYYICSCKHFKFRKWPDDEPDGELHVPTCKHILNVSKEQRAKSDESQRELINE
jgi:hypothetical protein